jgi:hypothetical protein
LTAVAKFFHTKEFLLVEAEICGNPAGLIFNLPATSNQLGLLLSAFENP